MPRPQAPVRRPPYHALLITGPLVLLGVGLSLPVLLSSPDPWRNWGFAPVFVAALALAAFVPLHIPIRRQTVTITLTDIPFLLALFYLSPALVLTVRLVAWALSLLIQRVGWTKSAFNLAAPFAATAVANLVITLFQTGSDGLVHPLTSVGPRTWIVLAIAVAGNAVTTFCAVSGVILLMQGPEYLTQIPKNIVPVLLVPTIATNVGLIMLLALKSNPWASVLLFTLAAGVMVAYRAYTEFLRQHRSLTELYDLARVVSSAGQNDSLADVLVSRVRALMQAESATLWLPRSGRHGEILLASQVDYPGLLDHAPTPDDLRRQAMRSGSTVEIGPKVGDEHLRGMLRQVGIRDAVVVPLRSGEVTIGTLEVSGGLGAAKSFTHDDVRLLEMLAAQAGVAIENSRLVERLRYDANHDALTGLPNRRRMLEAFGEAIKAHAEGEVIVVLIFDVVALRQVNDSLGYAAGDKVLVEVARQLRALAPPAAMVAKVGGDEFAVELRVASTDEAVTIAEELRANLRVRMAIETLIVEVDTNVGIAVYPDHGTAPDTLLQRADVATYVAKSRGVVQLFNAGLESRPVRRLGLANDLRTALDAGEIEVYFQPQVSLRDRRLVGVECLARWEHPVHGSVTPQDFVAVAEHTGQLDRLTETVLQAGLRRAREWADAGRTMNVAVNLSPRTLLDEDFPARVAALLAEHRVAADRLTLEFTEAALVAGSRPLTVLRRLREFGIRLSVDDFGSGQSSLASLRGLPVQEVKIDRAVVQGMATDPGDLAIVRTVVDMARHFSLSVVAEGVESELTLGLLEDVGCDVGQGFLFSRALPAERFDTWLLAQEQADPVAAGELRWLRAVP